MSRGGTQTPRCPECGELVRNMPLAPWPSTYRVPLPHDQPCRVVVEVRPTGDIRTISVPDDKRYEDLVTRRETVA